MVQTAPTDPCWVHHNIYFFTVQWSCFKIDVLFVCAFPHSSVYVHFSLSVSPILCPSPCCFLHSPSPHHPSLKASLFHLIFLSCSLYHSDFSSIPLPYTIFPSPSLPVSPSRSTLHPPPLTPFSPCGQTADSGLYRSYCSAVGVI